MNCELYNDNFQNYKVYGIPKAQLVIADMPYQLGSNAYGSNPKWYVDGDNKNGESELAGKTFFRAEDARIETEVMRDEVKEMLESFDTAEARDRFRMAKQFEEMAYQENAYQRTEYTKGLALIMAGLDPENKDVSGGAK